jgi:hypothetical protein
MNLPAFLVALFENGQTSVGSILDDITPQEFRAAEEILSQAEATHRLNFPGTAPTWDGTAGFWAARFFYRACQLAVQRDIEVESRSENFDEPCPTAPLPSTLYSVDLVFQFLPDLFLLARRSAPEDPLLAILNQWAVAWPLSSVGMNVDSQKLAIAPLLTNELLPFYAERIIARRDASRLGPPIVNEEVQKQLGMYEGLAPELWDALVTSKTNQQ